MNVFERRKIQFLYHLIKHNIFIGNILEGELLGKKEKQADEGEIKS